MECLNLSRGGSNAPTTLSHGVQFAREHFKRVLIADSSTLEALLQWRLQDKQEPWRGRATVVDLVTRLPVHIWFEEKVVRYLL